MSKRIKAKIITVGYVDVDGQPKNWGFDFEDQEGGVGVEITGESIIYCGGYTVDELREIASSILLR